jgi:hypothetical protein
MLAARVPGGRLGNSEFRERPSSQRSIAPADAPTLIASIECNIKLSFDSEKTVTVLLSPVDGIK